MSRRTALSRHIRITIASFMFACALAVLGAASSVAQNNPVVSGLTADEVTQIATDAYIYGYSLITTEVTQSSCSAMSTKWKVCMRPQGSS